MTVRDAVNYLIFLSPKLCPCWKFYTLCGAQPDELGTLMTWFLVPCVLVGGNQCTRP